VVDTICRTGGDEFVVVLPEIKRAADAAGVAHKIIENLSQPIRIEERELTVTPSIGISIFPDDGRDAETLIRNADAAMYHAKEMGLILKIGEWMLREACRWATFIGVERGLPVSVNLSARQFNDPRLVQIISRALKESGLPPQLLELEITESTAMQQTETTMAT